jgi:hypothetical protein
MKKRDIITILQNGIGEVTYTDEYSVEHSIMATLAPMHLPDEDSSGESSGLLLSVFNVNSEEWQLIPFGGVVDIEQLTGHGAEANEGKLHESVEYMKQLELFAEDAEETEPDSEDLE